MLWQDSFLYPQNRKKVVLVFKRVCAGRSCAICCTNHGASGKSAVQVIPDQIESDFELDLKASKPTIVRNEGRNGMSVRIEDVVVATVNGGGPVIKLKTLSGNIRIKKSP